MTTLTELPGVTHRYVTARGLRFHVAEAGGDGPPVLLLHGFPQHWYAWRHVLADLAADHRVYAMDLRGAGWSDAPRRGYDTANLVRDVLAVLDGLGARRVRLVGHEWGGWLGFHLALAAPERFAGYVAVNAPHPWMPHGKVLPHVWRYWYTALFEYPLLGAWIMRARPGVLAWLLRRGRPSLPAADVDVFVERTQQRERARAAQQVHWQLVLRDIPRRALGRYRHRGLTVPTLLLAGDRDFAVAPGSVTGAAVPRLHVRVVPGGHYLPEQRPDVVAAAVRNVGGH
ncbi:MAG TPA: alpha/beta fold hydrolase [Jatrophihabitantaceae bacterium]|jgi:pimeloyl-ACP methyl ester carboxylesterase